MNKDNNNNKEKIKITTWDSGWGTFCKPKSREYRRLQKQAIQNNIEGQIAKTKIEIINEFIKGELYEEKKEET